MSNISSKVIGRFKENFAKMQKVLEQAKARDINEADTVAIVSDLLTNIFGYDKYNEITHEYSIKSTYCDLAIKLNNELKFLIEVKAIGISLMDKHYQQALDYGANNGTDWIVLTNGIVWRIYKVKFEKPIHTDFVCEYNLLEMKPKNESDIEKLFILCKEGLNKNAIDEFSQHKSIVNRYCISAILQSDSIVESVKREFKKIDPMIKAENDEVLTIIKNEILKRDVIDTPEANEAIEKYSKALKKIDKQKNKKKIDMLKKSESNSDNKEIQSAEKSSI